MIGLSLFKPSLLEPRQTFNALIPAMTSNSGSNGAATGSGAFNGTFDFWKAFDNITSSYWAPLGIGANEWCGYQFTNGGKIINKYSTVYFSTVQTYAFEGSIDGTTFTLLDSQTSSLGGTFPITNSVQYTWYRVRSTTSGPDLVSFQLYG